MALESFGLGGDKATADRLFHLYDWRQKRNVNFQVTYSVHTNQRISFNVNEYAGVCMCAALWYTMQGTLTRV